MPITPLPVAPSKLTNTTAEFTQKADVWVAALGDFTTEANALEVNVNSKETAAAASAAAALVSEAAAEASAVTAVTAPGTTATSTTSLTISAIPQSLTIQTGKTIVVGMKVVIAATAAPNTFMYGTVTSYNSGSGVLNVNVTGYEGSGTIASWTISVTGPANVGGSAPVGTILLWTGGYFTDTNNNGYTSVLPAANTKAAVNTLLNPYGWYVCDGAELNIGAGIFNGVGRHLPKLDKILLGGLESGTDCYYIMRVR